MRDFALVMMLMFGCCGCISLDLQTPIGSASAGFGDGKTWWRPKVSVDLTVENEQVENWVEEKVNEKDAE